MIKITKYKAIDKGFLLATFSIEVPAWKMFINDLTYFQKDNKRWVSFPNKPYEVEGVKKYFPFVGFTDAERNTRFQEACLMAIDQHLATLPKEQPSLFDQAPQNGQASVKCNPDEVPF